MLSRSGGVLYRLLASLNRKIVAIKKTKKSKAIYMLIYNTILDSSSKTEKVSDGYHGHEEDFGSYFCKYCSIITYFISASGFSFNR